MNASSAFTPWRAAVMAADVAAYDAAVTDLTERHEARKARAHAAGLRIDAFLAKWGAV